MDNSDACQELARVCEGIIDAEPAIGPEEFLRRLGSLVAGIDQGVEGIADLARGGTNELWGAGFAPEFDDGSLGQARHFAGTAAAVQLFGGRVTGFVAHTFLDPANTPDGRLTTAAIVFATGVLDGTLPLVETATWIREHLCLVETEQSAMRINPPQLT